MCVVLKERAAMSADVVQGPNVQFQVGRGHVGGGIEVARKGKTPHIGRAAAIV